MTKSNTGGKKNICDQVDLVPDNKIQDFAVIVIHDTNGIITSISDNVSMLFATDAQNLLGKSLYSVFDDSNQKKYNDWLNGPIYRDYQPIITMNGQDLWLRKQLITNSWLIEIEHPKSPPLIASFNTIFEILNLSKLDGPQNEARLDLKENMVDLVFNTLEFEVVRLYKLDADCSGTVIVERKHPEVDSYLNYHFLATDVPKNVRDNFHDILYRYIPSTKCNEHLVLTDSNDDIKDKLSLSDSRYVTSVHKQYLNNMGVQAAFSVPIFIENKLWGFLACQQRLEKYIHPQDRFFCRLLVEYFSIKLNLLYQKEKVIRRDLLLSLQSYIEDIAEQHERLLDLFVDDRILLNKHMDSCGYVIKIEGDCVCIGVTPTQKEINLLIDWVKLETKGNVFCCNDLRELFPASKKFSQPLYGLLAIRLSKTDEGFILFFKKEYVETIVWAGDPKTAVNQSNETEGYSPRSSFSAWVEKVKGYSKAWSEIEIKFANVLKEIIADKWLQQILITKSTIDPLTHAYNRNSLDENIKKITIEKRQEAYPLCVAMVDIDNFKKLNDTYGHAFGDEVLAKVSHIIVDHVRDSDRVYRYGGEEFVIILKSCTIENAYKIMSSVLESIGQHSFQFSKKKQINVTVSIGVSVGNTSRKKIASLIQGADKAMYQAKKNGKNQVVID